MGFVVKRLAYKARKWKIQFESRKNNLRQTKDIPEEEYLTLGFFSSMTIDQVKERVSLLNKQEHIKRIQEKRLTIKERILKEDVTLDLHFPEIILDEFERIFVTKDKMKSHWRAAQRIIVKLNIQPKDWNYHKDLFYKEFIKNNFSYSYVQKLLYITNKYGEYLSRKQQTYFEHIPFPTGNQKERIIDNHYDEKGQTSSSALTPELLESIRSNLKPEQYNWLYLATRLGTRPNETDMLLKDSSPSTWWIENNVLWLYQSKLTSIPKPKRYKPIPLQFEDQKICVDIINNKNFKRPLNKVLKHYLNGKFTCYGPRKSFVDTMLDRGVSLEAAAQRLGHTNIQITWKIYKDKKKILY